MLMLDEPPLTLLLSAQAAQLEGDDQAARGYFEAMLDQPATAFLGLRGLLVQAERTGDTAQGAGAGGAGLRAQAGDPLGADGAAGDADAGGSLVGRVRTR